METGRLASTWWTLKIALGLFAFLAGLDKFVGLLTTWTDYINPAVIGGPVSPELLVRGIGVLEMLLAFAILTRWTKLGGYLAAAWLTLIAANLFAMGKFLDVAVADLILAVMAFTLGRLTAPRPVEETEAIAEMSSEQGFLRLNL